jgi:hypothetical protein
MIANQRNPKVAKNKPQTTKLDAEEFDVESQGESPAAASIAPPVGELRPAADDVAAASKPSAEPQRGQQGDDGRPYCPLHNVLMVAYSSKETTTHYKCPVAGCETTAKKARPTIHIPSQPIACPRQTCNSAPLEVDPKGSNLVQLQMTCPKCGFQVGVPRPQFDAKAYRRRQLAEDGDLAAR